MADRDKIIKGLQSHIAMNCEKNACPYWKYYTCAEMLLMDALELLREQAARKPIYNEQKYGDHLPHCGNCEKVLPNNAIYGKVNFCHYCGQAVKWDD